VSNLVDIVVSPNGEVVSVLIDKRSQFSPTKPADLVGDANTRHGEVQPFEGTRSSSGRSRWAWHAGD